VIFAVVVPQMDLLVKHHVSHVMLEQYHHQQVHHHVKVVVQVRLLIPLDYNHVIVVYRGRLLLVLVKVVVLDVPLVSMY
jgi:hypothetical protein